MNEIMAIPISELIHHPKNPRKQIGDVADLAASIKASGIMQNLTVVPDKNYDPDPGQPMERYLVVIGNRRLEAARLAGLQELPCVVSSMDEAEQLTTMLSENMQRSDLTITEQIDGIQQCLDLGMTDQEVRRKTGLGKTAYSERKKLSKCKGAHDLDKAMAEGFTIRDFLRIEGLNGIDKSLIYTMIDTGSDPYTVRASIDKAEKEMAFQAWKKNKWVPFAEEIKASAGTSYYPSYVWNDDDGKKLGEFSPNDISFDVEIPEMLPGDHLAWHEEHMKISLYIVYGAKRSDDDGREVTEEDKMKAARLAIKKRRSDQLLAEIDRLNNVRLEWICEKIRDNEGLLDDPPYGYPKTGWKMYQEILSNMSAYKLADSYEKASLRESETYQRLMESVQHLPAPNMDSYLKIELRLLNYHPTLLWFIFKYSWFFTRQQDTLFTEWNNDIKSNAWNAKSVERAKEKFWPILEDLFGYKPTKEEQALIDGVYMFCDNEGVERRSGGVFE